MHKKRNWERSGKPQDNTISGMLEKPNFFLQYDLIIGDKPKKNLYNGIAKSRRQKKTA